MKNTISLLLIAFASTVISSCRYTHADQNDSDEESATQTMAEGQGGETSADTTTSAEIQGTVPQEETKSSNPQGDVAPREANGAEDK